MANITIFVIKSKRAEFFYEIASLIQVISSLRILLLKMLYFGNRGVSNINFRVSFSPFVCLFIKLFPVITFKELFQQIY
jgi:hypothetical protein